MKIFCKTIIVIRIKFLEIFFFLFYLAFSFASIIIDKGLKIIEEIETTREIVEKIKDSKNFAYKVKIKKYKQIDLKPGIHTTT